MRLDPVASDARPSRTRMPVQRSNGSKVARVDDPRAAGDRLEPPAPFAVEARGGHAQAEAQIGACLEALDPGVLAQQARAGPGRPRRRGRRPGWSGRSEPELGKERGRRGRDRGASPRRSAAWRGRRRGVRPAPRSGRSALSAPPTPRSTASRLPSSAADRVPDRLHLEEGGDPFGSFGGGVVEPVEAGLGDRRRSARAGA